MLEPFNKGWVLSIALQRLFLGVHGHLLLRHIKDIEHLHLFKWLPSCILKTWNLVSQHKVD